MTEEESDSDCWCGEKLILIKEDENKRIFRCVNGHEVTVPINVFFDSDEKDDRYFPY